MIKKSKKIILVFLIIASLIGITWASFSIYNYAVGHKVKEHIENGVVTSIEYDGKTYHLMKLGAKYYKFIRDEEIARKPNLFYTRTYSALKNDSNNNFIHGSFLMESELYTCLPIYDGDDLIQGEITSVLVCQEGWNFEKEFVVDNEVVEFAKALNNYSYAEEETIQIKKREASHYSIYFSYDNLPVCKNKSISIACYENEFYYLTETTDYGFKGVKIDCEKLENICNSFSENID